MEARVLTINGGWSITRFFGLQGTADAVGSLLRGNGCVSYMNCFLRKYECFVKKQACGS